MTWFNPQAIIDGTMMLGAFRASLPAGGDLPFICGFGSASVIWFLALSTIVSPLGARFNEKVLNIINKVCGAVIIFYGQQAHLELRAADGLGEVKSKQQKRLGGHPASFALRSMEKIGRYQNRRPQARKPRQATRPTNSRTTTR
ncbi:MAG: LysE family transporter [Lachnospiraceae bacterium]